MQHRQLEGKPDDGHEIENRLNVEPDWYIRNTKYSTNGVDEVSGCSIFVRIKKSVRHSLASELEPEASGAVPVAISFTHLEGVIKPRNKGQGAWSTYGVKRGELHVELTFRSEVRNGCSNARQCVILYTPRGVKQKENLPLEGPLLPSQGFHYVSLSRVKGVIR